ncbi:hypothetical protein HNR25_001865 [Streptomonospora salina]|uniref:Uncharacterized protein n=1 Tax=Streptomonospora salina TaxID=104205 RepID=A0A841E6P2_9ACTN|nr:hypothetical protein [Streptomonospora salina]
MSLPCQVQPHKPSHEVGKTVKLVVTLVQHQNPAG